MLYFFSRKHITNHNYTYNNRSKNYKPLQSFYLNISYQFNMIRLKLNNKII